MTCVRKKPRRGITWILCLVLAVLAAGGCSSASQPALTQPVLRGVYQSADTGEFSWIDFTDATNYALWKNAPCSTAFGTDDSCGHTGTYEVHQDGLTLTDGQTGHTTVLSIQVLQLASAVTTPLSFQPQGSLRTAADPQALVTSDAGAAPSAAPLVVSFATQIATGASPQKLVA